MNKEEVSEQIQEDILTFMDDRFVEDGWDAEFLKDNLCQIVVDNFKKLED
jgi:hypothetical protein